MADSAVPVTGGSGYNIDTRTVSSGDHRQVIAHGDPSDNNAVAAVVSADPGPTSTAYGSVVRIAGSAQVSGITQSIAVYFDRANPNVTANAGTGSFTVQFDPGHELGSIKGVNSSVAVYFDRSSPNVSFDAQYSGGTAIGVGSVTSLVIMGLRDTSGNARPVRALSDSVDSAATGGGLSLETGSKIFTFNGSSWDRARSGSGVSNAAVRVVHATDVAGSVNISAIGTTQTLSVYLPDTGHEIGTIRGNTNTLTVFLPDTGHTLGNIGSVSSITNTVSVQFSPSNPAVNITAVTTGTAQAQLGKMQGQAYAGTDVGVALMGVRNDTNVARTTADGQYAPVQIGSSGRLVVTPVGLQYANTGVELTTAGGLLVNVGSTVSLFTVSGSASGVSVSGNTLISPSSAYNFKVYAFSIQTTALVSLTCKLTNGAGTSPTEFFRPLITAASTTSSPIGANLAVTPPGYIFATGTNTTLSLVLDSASLVHYSISYIKESA